MPAAPRPPTESTPQDGSCHTPPACAHPVERSQLSTIQMVMVRLKQEPQPAVYGDVTSSSRRCREGGENATPEAPMAPSVEAVVYSRRRTVVGPKILPAAPDPQHMNNAADDPAVIYPPRPRLVPRQKWLNRRRHSVRKPKSLA